MAVRKASRPTIGVFTGIGTPTACDTVSTYSGRDERLSSRQPSWPFRKARRDDWPKLLQLLLTGRPVKAKEAVGWLVDYAGPLDEAIKVAWQVVSKGDHQLKQRPLADAALDSIPGEIRGLPEPDSPGTESARGAILECVRQACGTPLAEALAVQAKLAAAFLTSSACREGRVGAEYVRTMAV